MPEARTKHFAVIEYDDSAVLTFPAGLPAFEHLKRFVLLERASTSPVVFLQSLDEAGVCLPAAPISAICPDYDLALTPDDLASLEAGAGSGEGLACLAVIAIPDEGPATANLLAPIVVNLARRRAVQAIRADTRYSHQYPVRGEAACS
jgi:flagellar assembly factor FliW